MGIVLGPNQYGKAENRVVRIYRDTERHEIRDVNVSTSLRGDFSAAHYAGDQSDVPADGLPEADLLLLRQEKGIRRIEATRRTWPATSSTTSSRSPGPGSRSRSTPGTGVNDHTTTRGSARGGESRRTVVTVDGEGIGSGPGSSPASRTWSC